MPFTSPFVWLERVYLALHAQPNAVELYHSRDIGDGFTPCLPKEGFDLIHPVIDRA